MHNLILTDMKLSPTELIPVLEILYKSYLSIYIYSNICQRMNF